MSRRRNDGDVAAHAFGADGEYALGIAAVSWDPKDARENVNVNDMDGRNIWAGVGP